MRTLLHVKLNGSLSALRKFIGSRGGIVPFILKLVTRSRWMMILRKSCRYSVIKALVGHYDPSGRFGDGIYCLCLPEVTTRQNSFKSEWLLTLKGLKL